MHGLEALNRQLAARLAQVRDLKDKLSEMEDERDRLAEEVARLKADNARLEDLVWDSRD
jgi:uncharacterized protein (DUF3084 family)